MSDIIFASVYGTSHNDDWVAQHRKKTFNYIKALIEAEKLNPEKDYDSERYIVLLKMIASSSIDSRERSVLICLLDEDKNKEEL